MQGAQKRRLNLNPEFMNLFLVEEWLPTLGLPWCNMVN